VYGCTHRYSHHLPLSNTCKLISSGALRDRSIRGRVGWEKESKEKQDEMKGWAGGNKKTYSRREKRRKTTRKIGRSESKKGRKRMDRRKK
jgi:hypothetical protein